MKINICDAYVDFGDREKFSGHSESMVGIRKTELESARRNLEDAAKKFKNAECNFAISTLLPAIECWELEKRDLDKKICNMDWRRKFLQNKIKEARESLTS